MHFQFSAFTLHKQKSVLEQVNAESAVLLDPALVVFIVKASAVYAQCKLQQVVMPLEYWGLKPDDFAADPSQTI